MSASTLTDGNPRGGTAVDPAYVTAAPVNPAGLPTAYEHGGRLTPEGTTVDPILVEICLLYTSRCV